jgi:5-methylcytosine-specific restriction protein A
LKHSAKGRGIAFLGVFCCMSWECRKALDAKGVQRQVIVFHLIQLNDGAVSNGHDIPIPHSATPLEELRRRAMEASVTAPQLSPKESRHLYYERSEAVRQHVLARAAGVCEACRQSAPFARPDGSPYLEPHHTRRLSDGGPDDPRYVAGICPTCHRRIHYCTDGDAVNSRVMAYVARIET